jgi:hypothetical protein
VKPQDLVFILLTAIIAMAGRTSWLPVLAIIFFLLSALLFSFRIFFTAERLVMYALVYVLVFAVLWAFRFRGKIPL